MTSTFDHRQAGTSESVWNAAGLENLPSLQVPTERVVVLAAHPDDESLGAGGLIAAAARRGAEVVVVIATDGEASHPGSTTRTPAELATLRRHEVSRAVAQLAPQTDVRHLCFPDGKLDLFGDALHAALQSVLGTGPALLVAPWDGDRHPDHEACGRVAARIAADTTVTVWQYPIWAWHWGTPGDLPMHRCATLSLDRADRDAKRAALAEHVSQHLPLSDKPGDEPVLPAHVLTHFDRPYECFVLADAPSTSASYFDKLYDDADDPWGLGDRFYEQRKRAVLLASLPRRRFRRAFEPGCATGLLTEQLLDRCDEVVARDVAAAAVRQTIARLATTGHRGWDVACGAIPDHWPDGSFDLIVLSEVGYYCADLGALTHRVLGSLSDDGVVIACHWRHRADDHAHTADDVHDALDAVLVRDLRHEEADFRLDVWTRTGGSVAAAEGIV